MVTTFAPEIDGNPCDMAYAIDSAYTARVFIVLMPVLLGVGMLGALAVAFGGGIGSRQTYSPQPASVTSGGVAGSAQKQASPLSPVSTQMTPVGVKASAPLPPQNSGGELPAGWKRAVDKKSGRTYYVEVATQRTTWTRPR